MIGFHRVRAVPCNLSMHEDLCLTHCGGFSIHRCERCANMQYPSKDDCVSSHSVKEFLYQRTLIMIVLCINHTEFYDRSIDLGRTRRLDS